jgi:hypothetical protein
MNHLNDFKYHKIYSFFDINGENCCPDNIMFNKIKYKCIQINFKNTEYYIIDVVYKYELKLFSRLVYVIFHFVNNIKISLYMYLIN